MTAAPAKSTLPFPTAAEAAKQARPKYMEEQIRAIEEKVKKAIQAGRYRTEFELYLPSDYDVEENLHRNAVIAEAFPTYKIEYGFVGNGRCNVTVSWVPKVYCASQ
jgi:hypothetical protein